MLTKLFGRNPVGICALAFLLIIGIAFIAVTSASANDEQPGRETVEVSISDSGRSVTAETPRMTVEDVLRTRDIPLGQYDIVEPAEDTIVQNGTEIVIKRVVMKKETVKETFGYKTIRKTDSSLKYDQTKVVQKGSKGEDEVTYKTLCYKGKEISRKEISRTTIKKVKNRVVSAGYKKEFTVRAYAYTGGGHTASGTNARVGAIAVDPDVIPLGTKVYVQGYGFATAEDTGGSLIRGKAVDLYMNSASQCRSWGVKSVKLYII